MLQKLIAGGPGRPTRLHTEAGSPIPAAELRHVPKVLLQYLSRRATGKRPIEPWWPLSVIPVIDLHLTANSRVIEFGSGGSTLWLAKRSHVVIAVEDNVDWCVKVHQLLKDNAVTNATVRFAEGPDYYDLSWNDGQGFDLAVVDGSHRWRCVEAVLPLMNSGSIIYLDNSDADKDRKAYPEPNMDREAQSCSRVSLDSIQTRL